MSNSNPDHDRLFAARRWRLQMFAERAFQHSTLRAPTRSDERPLHCIYCGHVPLQAVLRRWCPARPRLNKRSYGGVEACSFVVTEEVAPPTTGAEAKDDSAAAAQQ